METPSSQETDSLQDSPAVTLKQRAFETLQALKQEFAVLRDYQPLAIGIDKQLFASKPDISRRILRLALNLHTHSLRYVKSIQCATHRFNLDGSQSGPISDAHHQHASETMFARLKKNKTARRPSPSESKPDKPKPARCDANKLNALFEKFNQR